MKPLVIYHANCADGFGAAFAAWLVLGDDAEYRACQYGEQADTWMEKHNAEVTGRDVYILDFSFNRKTMKDFFELAECVVWLDHHKTVFEMWCGRYEKGIRFTQDEHVFNEACNPVTCTIILNDNKSGAVLAWEYFHPGAEVPQFIRHIDDYDRWQFKIEGTKAFNKALCSYAPFDFLDWNRRFIYADGKNRYHRFVEQGEAILRAHDQNVQSVVKGSARGVRVLIDVADHSKPDPSDSTPVSASDGYLRRFDGLAANCPPHLTSDVGHELATQSGTFGLCWTLSQTGLIAKCSLRSNGEYDVSAIAKVFGGGGHRNAAGFEVPLDVLLGWLK